MKRLKIRGEVDFFESIVKNISFQLHLYLPRPVPGTFPCQLEMTSNMFQVFMFPKALQLPSQPGFSKLF
jgi:hypothetical protein